MKPPVIREACVYALLRVDGRSTLLNGVLVGMSLAKASGSVVGHLKMLRDAVRGLRPLFFLKKNFLAAA